ncbi:MAG: carboxypeptidase regulatory-like domain-containing protein, partial [Spirochaetales bacterium]|nr:carboxypeptidase regulatory-like domain-containing protein [Spirochaetales bacterium]
MKKNKKGILIFLAMLSVTIFNSCDLFTEQSGNNRTVSGQVLTSDGTPLADVKITIICTETYEATTDSSGKFTITGISPGRYSIEAYLYDYTIASNLESDCLSLVWEDKSDLSLTAYTDDNIPIGVIQGTGHTSPIKGQAVYNIEGIVTCLYSNEEKGFFMQDPEGDGNDSTSDGIFVKTHSELDEPLYETVPTDLTVGDLVKVSGTVDEQSVANYLGYSDGYLTITMIDKPIVTILSSNNTLPEAIEIGDNGKNIPYDTDENVINFWEPMEGMRVKLEDPLTVGEDSYCNFPCILNGGAHMNLDGIITDNGGYLLVDNVQNPERCFIYWEDYDDNPLAGSSFSAGDVTGVVSYTGNGIYTVNPASSSDIGSVNGVYADDLSEETTTIVGDSETLTVAVYNIENYGPEWEDDSETAEDADNYDDRNQKATALADDIVNNLGSPDIIVLVEMGDDYPTKVLYQNTMNSYYIPDGETSAEGNAKKLITKIKAIDSSLNYSYTDIAPEDGNEGGKPGMNIRVGFLYNTNRVNFTKVGDADFDDQTCPVKDNDGNIMLSQNPGRILDSSFNNSRRPLVGCFEFNDEPIIIIGCHLKSKLGDSPVFGAVQPPVFSSEAKRVKQAEAVAEFAAKCLTMDSNANVIICGDMNDYGFSEAVEALEVPYM